LNEHATEIELAKNELRMVNQANPRKKSGIRKTLRLRVFLMSNIPT